MAIKADETKPNNPDVLDLGGQEIAKATLDSLEKELELHKSNLQHNTDGKERFVKQWERDQKIWKFMMQKHKKLPDKMTYEYELIPEYWDLRLQQLQDKYEEDKFRTESRIEKFDMDDKAIREQIKSIEIKIKELKGDEE